MNPEDLLHILEQTLSVNNEERNQAVELQRQCLESDPATYFSNLIQISLSVEDPVKIKMAFVSMYSVFLHCKELINGEILTIIFNNFVLNAPSFFKAEYVEENTKKLIEIILSEVTCSIYKESSENTQMQEFLLATVENSPDIASYIINTISLIIFSSDDYCNFELAQLAQIIILEIDPILKINLYFAIALHAPIEQEEIHYIFNEVLCLIEQSGNIEKCFKIINTFVEKNTEFIHPHVEDFFGFICKCILQESPEVQIAGLFIIKTVAEKDKDLCINNEGFYKQVFDTMIKVMSQITEESNYEIDTNDREPCAIARLVFRSLHYITLEDEPSQFFKDYISSIIEEGPENQLLYGVLIALSEIFTGNILDYDYANFNVTEVTEHCAYPFILLATSPETEPRIRYAAYCVLKRLAKDFILYSPLFAEHLIQSSFEILKASEEIGVSIAILKFLSSYIMLVHDIELYYDYIYSELKELISCVSDEVLMQKLIRVLKILFKNVRRNEKLNQINIEDAFAFLLQIISRVNDFNIKAEAICCFKYLLSNQTFDSVPDLQDIVKSLFDLSKELLDSGRIAPNYFTKLMVIQMIIIPLLGENFEEYKDVILTHLIKIIKKKPKCITINMHEEEKMEFISLSEYYKLPVTSNVLKEYVKYKTIKYYQITLISINQVCYMLQENFEPYIGDFLGALFTLLSREKVILPINITCWDTIFTILESQIKASEPNVTYFETIITKFIENVQCSNDMYFIEKMYSKLEIILKALIRIPSENFKKIEESIKPQLVALFDLFIYFKQIIELNVSRCDEEDSEFDINSDYCGCDEIRELITIFKHLYCLMPEETIYFYSTKLHEEGHAKIKQRTSLNIEIPLLSIVLFNEARDVESQKQYITFVFNIFSIINELEEKITEDQLYYDDLFSFIINQMIKFVLKNDISRETAIELFHFFYKIIEPIQEVFNYSSSNTEDNLIIICHILYSKYKIVENLDLVFNLITEYANHTDGQKYDIYIPFSIVTFIFDNYDEYFGKYPPNHFLIQRVLSILMPVINEPEKNSDEEEILNKFQECLYKYQHLYASMDIWLKTDD